MNSITMNLYYTGENGNAQKFAQEMESSGTAAAIRADAPGSNSRCLSVAVAIRTAAPGEKTPGDATAPFGHRPRSIFTRHVLTEKAGGVTSSGKNSQRRAE